MAHISMSINFSGFKTHSKLVKKYFLTEIYEFVDDDAFMPMKMTKTLTLLTQVMVWCFPKSRRQNRDVIAAETRLKRREAILPRVLYDARCRLY